MNGTSTGYLTFSLSPNGFLSDFNAPLHQILVVKQQMLFQTGVGNTAGFGTLLYRDVAVRTQKFHSLGVLLFAVLTCAPRQVVTQAQPLAYLLPPFDDLGIVRAQLATEVRTLQSELACDLRDVVFDVVQTPARLDGILVLGMGGR